MGVGGLAGRSFSKPTLTSLAFVDRVETRYTLTSESIQVVRLATHTADYGARAPSPEPAKSTAPVPDDAPRVASSALTGTHQGAIPLDWVRFIRQPAPGSVDVVIAQALDMLRVPLLLRSRVAALVKFVALHESGFDATAVNLWDSNAIGAIQADGAPLQSSRGWMQTIPQTFARYHVAGTSTNIYDPLSNICAALSYMADRYGVDLSTGDGLVGFLARSAGGYIGY
ncbi:transglycosylase SLT domain-containing protein [Gordonia sihwensis]|uniref:transglycosylase SLT domain-containing protein n=1 Tax=Gordonia sihwensis TaxID=173559 RepID=UPI003D9636F3